MVLPCFHENDARPAPAPTRARLWSAFSGNENGGKPLLASSRRHSTSTARGGQGSIDQKRPRRLTARSPAENQASPTTVNLSVASTSLPSFTVAVCSPTCLTA